MQSRQHTLAEDIVRLTRNGRGPLTQKHRLATWATVYAATGSLGPVDALERAVLDAMILAYANGSFSLFFVKPLGQWTLIPHDQGGLFAGMALAMTLIDLAPDAETRRRIETTFDRAHRALREDIAAHIRGRS